MSRVGLRCGACGNGAMLFSDEVASILYPVRFTEEEGLPGTRELTYTGEMYEVMDEGTEYRGHLYCRACGTGPFRMEDLVPDLPEEADDDA